MGRILDELRAEYAEEEAGRKWYQRPAQGDSTLYLSARMRDAEEEKNDMERRVVATENAAIDIIRRFDGDGTLVMEFKQLIEAHIERYRR